MSRPNLEPKKGREKKKEGYSCSFGLGEEKKKARFTQEQADVLIANHAEPLLLLLLMYRRTKRESVKQLSVLFFFFFSLSLCVCLFIFVVVLP